MVNADARVGRAERASGLRVCRRDRVAEVSFVLGRDRADRDRVPRNGVPAVAAVERDETERRHGEGRAEHVAEHLGRVGMNAGDVNAGVPAQTAARRHRERDRVGDGRLARLLDRDRADGAAGGADRQLAVLLTVEVEENRPGQKGGVEAARALVRTADFLVHRHQQLERTVRDRRVLGQRHHRRDADAVIRAERRPVGGQPVAVADERDPALGRIVRATRQALADHVQMSLQDENRRRLTTRASRDAHDDVLRRILPKLESAPGSPGLDVLDHQLLVTRRSRDSGQGLELVPQSARLEACERDRPRGAVRHRCRARPRPPLLRPLFPRPPDSHRIRLLRLRRPRDLRP